MGSNLSTNKWKKIQTICEEERYRTISQHSYVICTLLIFLLWDVVRSWRYVWQNLRNFNVQSTSMWTSIGLHIDIHSTYLSCPDDFVGLLEYPLDARTMSIWRGIEGTLECHLLDIHWTRNGSSFNVRVLCRISPLRAQFTEMTANCSTKAFCVFTFHACRSVSILQRRFRTKFGKTENSIRR